MAHAFPKALAATARRSGAVILGVASIATLSGCFATSKQVDLLEGNVTRQNAWDDQRFQQLTDELVAVQAENETLRLRLDEVTTQVVQLGGEVSNRITELAQADERVVDEARLAKQSVESVQQEQERDREALLDRMNVILEEVLKENASLTKRLDALERSALVYGKAHKVQQGETVATIAAKYGTTAQAIIDANGLPDANVIRVGQDLVIPGVGE
jgi:LysM repeat protein